MTGCARPPHRLARRLVSLAVLATLGAPVVRAETAAITPTLPAVLRDARYCEIIPIDLTLEGLRASVYNTLDFDDCPADKWEALTQIELLRQFETLAVVMNGPRHFLMDDIIAAGATKTGDVITIGGITLAKRAEVGLSVHQAMGPAYTEQTIERDTTYRFDAGKPVFTLTAPDGSVYVMQSYAQIVDPKLAYGDLPTLGNKLKLPAGWSYGMLAPDKDLLLEANGTAIVIQDTLKNTYQKMAPN